MQTLSQATAIAFASFASMKACLEHRKAHGGWIFEPRAGFPVWFSTSFTPSTIFRHSATRGMSDKLI